MWTFIQHSAQRERSSLRLRIGSVITFKSLKDGSLEITKIGKWQVVVKDRDWIILDATLPFGDHFYKSFRYLPTWKKL